MRNTQPIISDFSYTADTEFDASIFDFAMVNLKNPYLSIVQPLNTDSPFAVKWIGSHHKFWSSEDLKLLFSSARTQSQLKPLFDTISGKERSTVLYYKAHQDTIIPNAFGMATYDLSTIISKVASKFGASTEAAVSVRLGEIYDLLIAPIEFQAHLHQHSALTDALLLYELYHLGWLNI